MIATTLVDHMEDVWMLGLLGDGLDCSAQVQLQLANIIWKLLRRGLDQVRLLTMVKEGENNNSQFLQFLRKPMLQTLSKHHLEVV